ncbi:guanine nucleotide-binding protein-like 1 [Passer montanus]|uniref:guanine nucleotide-binding protein-like 1 n=1 Tax=Passer montanus TaxID=9160 RepID=UPI0019607BFD|nr:guanine nucleotide-binding protein-like 1 [Passer montanus]
MGESPDWIWNGPGGPASGPGSRSGSRERGGDGPPGDPPPEPPRRHDPGRAGFPPAPPLEFRDEPRGAAGAGGGGVWGLPAGAGGPRGPPWGPPRGQPGPGALRAQPGGLQKRQRKRGGRWGRAVGPRLLLEACQEIVGDAVDLSSWRARLERAEQRPEDEEDDEDEEEEEPLGRDEEEEEQGAGPGGVARPRQWERYRHGVLTLGCVGLPNAGKSSVLNALLGRGAVAVSRCPGRTRYFQTHFLTGSVRLCDCPGLVFPSRAPPELQVLAGVYPISQLQDPYSAVGFLGSRLALPPLLQLRPPSGPGWTAWELCEAWAEKRGYKTARAARNDVARAANGLLRLAAEGRLRLCMTPPGYTEQKEHWELHPDTAALAAMTGGGACAPPPPGAASSSEDDEGAEPEQATPPPSPAHNPFALLGEDEC